MKKKEPELHESIVEADRKSVKTRGGHGNAIAQVYNHSIMPLNDKRDKETQILWGIADFEYRFGRKPEGIWFAETAIDKESLLIASKNGIKFTILAPGQAKSFRPLGQKDEWKSCCDNSIDTTRAYLYKPSDDSEIALFFYDGGLAHSVAFDGALYNGESLGKKFIEKALSVDEQSGIIHIATDGESFGHHHRFGEMALAFAVKTIEEEKKVKLSNYGEFLANHPPEWEADIVEKSSWSCLHGVGRWQDDCGCSTGAGEGWNQKWRKPLRDGLKELKKNIDSVFEEELSVLLKSPWDARNEYIKIILDRNDKTLASFIDRHSQKVLSREEVVALLELMEMQVSAMKMFTSCGWFFADIGGLEGVQILKYAAKAIDRAKRFGKKDLEQLLLKELKNAESNLPQNGTGADIYRSWVKPLKYEPLRVVARTLIMNLLELEETETSGYSYDIKVLERHQDKHLDASITVGRVSTVSTVTLEEKKYLFTLLHLGGYDFNCAIIKDDDDKDFPGIKDDILNSFKTASPEEIGRNIKKHFPGEYLTFEALFDREREIVMEKLIRQLSVEIGNSYIELFDKYGELIHYLMEMRISLPDELKVAARYLFEKRLEKLFADTRKLDDYISLIEIIKEADRWGVKVAIKKTIKRMEWFILKLLSKIETGDSDEFIKAIIDTIDTVNNLKIKIDRWEIQNRLYPYYLAQKDSNHPLHKLVASKPRLSKLFSKLRFAP